LLIIDGRPPRPPSHSLHTHSSHSFFPIAIFSLNCRTMKTAPLALLAAFCLISYASAQNLIVNGDFETGMITPWTGGTIAPDISFGFNATTSGTLTQTVMTTASTKYLLSADLIISGIALPTATISAVPGAGGAPDGTRTVTANLVSPGFMRVFLLFTASSASTNVNFTATAVPFSSTITVDNVTLFEVEPSKLVGRYGGNIITTVSLTNLELTNKSGRKATARITDDNRIYIIDGSQAIFAGVILNNGVFNLNSLNTSTGGQAKILGKRIQLEFDTTSLFAADIAGTPVLNTVKNKVVLTRR
jgi:hypothetical protein